MQKSKSTDGGCCTTIKSQEIIRKYQTWNSWIHWKCQIQNIRNSKPLIMTLAGMPENRPRRSKYGPSAWKKCEKLKIDPAWPCQILEKNRVSSSHFRRVVLCLCPTCQRSHWLKAGERNDTFTQLGNLQFRWFYCQQTSDDIYLCIFFFSLLDIEFYADEGLLTTDFYGREYNIVEKVLATKSSSKSSKFSSSPSSSSSNIPPSISSLSS